MANDITYKIGVEETVSPALNKIQASVAKTSAAFDYLKGAIAGIAFGAAIQNALNYADAITDISDATNIAVASVIGFGKVVSESGGNAEKAQAALVKFTLSLGDAVNGGLAAQNAFAEVGVTLDDLRRLSEEDLFKKTLQGLSSISDTGERARLTNELLGKSLKGVNLKNIYEGFDNAAKASQKYAAATQSVGKFQDNLTAATGKIKLELISIIAPLTTFLNKFIEGGAGATVIANSLAIAMAAVAGGAVIVGINAVRTAIIGLAGAFGLTTAATTAETVALGANAAAMVANNALKAAGAAARVASLSASIAEARAIIANTVVTTELAAARVFLERTTWRLAAAQATLAESTAIVNAAQVAGVATSGAAAGGFAAMALSMGRIVIIAAAVTAAVIAINEAIKFAFDLDPIDAMATKLESLVTDTFPSLAAGINKIGEFLGMAAPPSQRNKEPGKKEDTEKENEVLKQQEEINRKIKDGLAKQRKEISLISAEFKKQLGDKATQLQFETELVGKSEKQKNLATALFDLRKKTADEVDKLTKARDTLGPDQKGLVGDYNKQIAAVKELGKVEEARLTNLVNGLTAAKQAQEITLFQTRETAQANDDLLRIQRELAQIGLGDQAKQQMDIAFAADERARAEIRSLEASRGTILSEQEKNKIFEISRSQLGALTDATNQLAAAKEAFAKAESIRLFDLKSEYDLQDKLLNIQRETADIGLLGIEKGYRDIARAADDSAKAAIRAEEERRSAIAGTRVFLDPAEVQEYYNKARKGTEDLVKAQKNLYDTSRKFSTGWNSAFKKYIEDATNAANVGTRMFEKFTSGIEDLIVDFAKTGKFEWKSFVASMGEELLRSQIKQTMASVLQMPNPFSSSGGSISDLFGGIFGALGGGGEIGSSASNPMYVVDIAGGGAGGGILGGGGAAGGGAGGGIMGTIGNIFTGVKDAVGSVFGGIGNAVSGLFGGGNSAPSTSSGGGFGGGIVDSIGSLFGGGGSSGGGGFLDSITSGIGDFFGGFFANGGNLAPGKFGVVGERGPEFIGGPASITPMSGSANVTYNINAVDARSFQQLLASDPSFIYALTEQGRKSFAGAR